MKVRNVATYSGRILHAVALPDTGLGDTVLIVVGAVLVIVAAGIAWMARSR